MGGGRDKVPIGKISFVKYHVKLHKFYEELIQIERENSNTSTLDNLQKFTIFLFILEEGFYILGQFNVNETPR